MISDENIIGFTKKIVFRKDRNRYESTSLAQVKCSGCGKIIVIQRGQLKNHSGKCKSCGKKGGIPWNKGKSNEKISGSRSPNWKGGTYISSDGYKQIKVGRGKTYKREHTLVMEQNMGRRLLNGEVVHHIDGQKLNNKIENLVLCKNSDHRRMHASLERIAFELFREGIIGFDKQANVYFKKR